MNKILSIIIPSYNKEKQLQRLLDSIVKSASFDDTIEIIVSDDCSTDNTQEVIKPYLEKYQNITYILPSKNGGVHTARNLGMEKANGEYIGFIDGDDWFNENGLELVLKKIEEHHEYEVIFYPYITSDTHELTGYNKTGIITLKELYITKKIFKKNKNCFAVIRNNVIKTNNIKWYYTNLDSLFWREVEHHAKDQSIYVTDTVVGVYDKDTEGSLSKKRSDINHLKKTADMKIEKTIEFLNRLETFFQNEKQIACTYIYNLKNDLILSKDRKSNYQLLEDTSKKYNCNSLKLFQVKYIPLVYYKNMLQLKNSIKLILGKLNGK
jgi:glycosyltransferase involved in cell wall biosynthesis